ncbi:MAG: HrgC protein [Sulfurospirillum sp.]|nr:HrgC protein [Sulfurospirillum sp.]
MESLNPLFVALLPLLVMSFILLPLIFHFRQQKVVLQHPSLKKTKVVPFLYSWTGLIFGAFVPLLRNDIKWFFIYFIVFILTSGLGNIVLSFFYNKSSLTALIEKGYVPVDDNSKQLLVSKNIIKAIE